MSYSCNYSISPTKSDSDNITASQSEDNYEHVTPGLVYCTTSYPGSSVDSQYSEQIGGCRCTDCSRDCGCIQLSGDRYRNGSLLNGSRPIFECNDDCSCDESCFNRLVQKGPIQGLKITKFPGKGLGVVSFLGIPKNTFVCEYAGELISIDEAKQRFSRQADDDCNYILVMREHYGGPKPQITVVDPTVVGNIGRYMNHSCQPNLQVVPVRINSVVPVAALFTLRSVSPGEELCYNYNESDPIPDGGAAVQMHVQSTCHSKSKDVNEKIYKPCLCASSGCIGYLPINNCFQ